MISSPPDHEWWTAPSPWQQIRKPYFLSPLAHFHGRLHLRTGAKTWTGGKQLRRLSTVAVLRSTHSHASASSAVYKSFSRINARVKTQSAALLFITVSRNVNTPALSHSPAWLFAIARKTLCWTNYIWFRCKVFEKSEQGEPRISCKKYDSTAKKKKLQRRAWESIT